MKQEKKLTKANKELMVKKRLNPDNWRVLSNSKTELVLINTRGRRRTILK